MSDKIQFHLDSAEQDPDLPDACPDFCPKCRVPAEHGFGLAGGGYGAYSYCPKCGELLGKVQVHD
jgi:hypothetical protein